MRNPPDLSEQTIKQSLVKNYQITIKDQKFIPEGASSWIYICQTDQGPKIVLKIKKKRNRKATIVYKYLTKQGFQYMPKLLFNKKGRVWSKVGHYYYYAQEYIEPKTGDQAYQIDDSSLPQLGIALKELHSIHLPWHIRLRLQTETFYSSAHQEISGYARDAEDPSTDMYQAPKEVYLQNREKIRALLDYCKKSGEKFKKERPTLVLAHDDIHGMNIICAANGELYIVDWDRCRMAPIENDLMYLSDRQLKVMSETYGHDLTANRPALKYYRSHLLLRDMCLFWGEAIKNENPETREQFLELFKKAIPKVDNVIAG